VQGMEAHTGPKKGSKKATNGESQAIQNFLEWMSPLALIVIVSAFLFLIASTIDFSGNTTGKGLLETLLFSDPESAATNVGNLAEVLIGVLGLTLTVVAIVVQLAAQRYTPKLVDLFLADRVNIFTFLSMVSATILCVWIIYSTSQDFTPVAGNLLLISVTTLLLALLIPYFNYVFRFLTPSSIIEKIEHNLAHSVEDVARSNEEANLEKYRYQVANGLEQVTDIALSAVTQMDRNVALMSIDTLRSILRSYLREKNRLPNQWFTPHPAHFISITKEFVDDIADRRIWVEARGLMDLELIFGLALKTMPDAVSAIAANTRHISMAAQDEDDHETAYLCIEYFNTFLRRAINDHNQRAVFSLLYQYRRLAEHMLTKRLDLSEEIAGFIHYYGQESVRVGMPFLMIAASMDLCTLLQQGYGKEGTSMDKILGTFLTMAENEELKKYPFAHQGVRKAHMILAAYLMSMGNYTNELKLIQQSLKNEKPAFLKDVQTSVLNVTKRKFWEVTDRGGINFEYIDPEMKEWLQKFYKKYIQSK